MKYKGIELKEITEPQIFGPPKNMLVWGQYKPMNELDVYAITSRKDFPVICENSTWRHCAEIPTVTESELVTYRELAHWLEKGNCEVKSANLVYNSWNYLTDDENEFLSDKISVRKWDDTEWHKPTREYIGLEDK